METIAELHQYLQEHDVIITDVARLRYSSGVMELVDINSLVRVRIDRIWTGYWTKKWKALPEAEFAEWVKPKVLKYLMSIDPSESLFYNSIHLIEDRVDILIWRSDNISIN